MQGEDTALALLSCFLLLPVAEVQVEAREQPSAVSPEPKGPEARGSLLPDSSLGCRGPVSCSLPSACGSSFLKDQGFAVEEQGPASGMAFCVEVTGLILLAWLWCRSPLSLDSS